MSTPTTPRNRRLRRLIADQWPVVIECTPSQCYSVAVPKVHLTPEKAQLLCTCSEQKQAQLRPALRLKSPTSPSLRLLLVALVALVCTVRAVHWYWQPSSAGAHTAARSKDAFTIEGHFSCRHALPRAQTVHSEIVGWEPSGPFSLSYDCIDEFKLILYQAGGRQHRLNYRPDIARTGSTSNAMHISASFDPELNVASMLLNGSQLQQYYVDVTAQLHTTKSSVLRSTLEAARAAMIELHSMRLWTIALSPQQVGNLITATASQTVCSSLTSEAESDSLGVNLVSDTQTATNAACIHPTVQLGIGPPFVPSIAASRRSVPNAPSPKPTVLQLNFVDWSRRLNNAFSVAQAERMATSVQAFTANEAKTAGQRYAAYGPIPRRIHQTYKHALPTFTAHDTSKGELTALVQSWEQQNPQHLYQLWNDTQVDQFVSTRYPDFYPVFAALPKPVLKADLFRYMIVYDEGGVYADVDTEALRPIEYWTQPHGRLMWSKTSQTFLTEAAYLRELKSDDSDSSDSPLSLPPINVIVGVEADFSGMPTDYTRRGYAAEHQLCQWTFASVAAHPMLAHVIQIVMQQLLSRTPSELLDANVLDMTGPGVWTTAIRDYLIRVEGLTSADALMGYTQSLQVGDIYILPVNGFGDTPRFRMAGADRANEAGLSPRCVEHHFAGSWKEDDDMWLAVSDRQQRAKQIRSSLHERVLNRTVPQRSSTDYNSQ